MRSKPKCRHSDRKARLDLAVAGSLGGRSDFRAYFRLTSGADQLIRDRREFAIDRYRATARFVNGRIFQLQRQLLLLALERGDVHFQLTHALLAFALLFRQRLAHFGLGTLLRFLFAQTGLVAGGVVPGSASTRPATTG